MLEREVASDCAKLGSGIDFGFRSGDASLDEFSQGRVRLGAPFELNSTSVHYYCAPARLELKWLAPIVALALQSYFVVVKYVP